MLKEKKTAILFSPLLSIVRFNILDRKNTTKNLYANKKQFSRDCQASYSRLQKPVSPTPFAALSQALASPAEQNQEATKKNDRVNQLYPVYTR